ncbi:hypothetical protein SUDANB95_06805 [Actinosynnema sp. ALI-1.44]
MITLLKRFGKKSALALAVAGVLGAVALSASDRAPEIVPVAATQADRASLGAETVRALDNLARTGKLSDADRKALAKNRDVARQVVDPAKTKVHEVSTATAGKAGKSGCHRADRYISYKTLLGAKAFEWHKVLHYCWSASGKVTIKERRHYIKNNDGFNYDRGLVSNTQSGKNTPHYASTMQGKVENCIVKYGCIKMNNPYIRIVVNGKKGLPYQIWQRP